MLKPRTCWADGETGGTLRATTSQPFGFWACLGCGHLIAYPDRVEHAEWHLRKRGLTLVTPRRRWWRPWSEKPAPLWQQT